MGERNTMRTRADECAVRIAQLNAELKTKKTRAGRKDIRQRRALLERVESFFRSRAGYE